MEKKTIKSSLNIISKDINDLESEKNLEKIVKQYNKINMDIKNTGGKIHKLKLKLEDDNVSGDEINDDLYEKLLKLAQPDNNHSKENDNKKQINKK